ncbi:MAG: FIST N-terminal domain-containing protein [Actinomycetota bacterium]
MIAGAGISTHPGARDATGEVIGQILERVGTAPELAVLVVAGHADELDEIVGAIRSTLTPGVLVGTSARTLVGGGREYEGRSAIGLLALHGAAGQGMRITTRAVDRGTRLDGLDPSVLARAHSLVLVADPFSFPAAAVLDHLSNRHPHLTIVGAMTSAAQRPGGNQLVLDDGIERSGAVALALDGSVRLDAVVSPACRPIGTPFTVTASDGPAVLELGGRPATERLRELLADLSPADRALATTGLHAGRVVDEHREAFGAGDFVIRSIRGIDRTGGSIVVGDRLPVGSIFQFQLRDPDAADRDLRSRLRDRAGGAALLFTCEGRGSALFGEPDHDAAVVDDLLDGIPLLGMSCSSEIGPGAAGTQLHGFTAALGILSDTGPRAAGASVVSEA